MERMITKLGLACDRFAELDGHFVATVGKRTRTSDFANVAGEVAVLDVDATGLADGQGASQEEGDAAEGEVASLDVVDIPCADAVEDGERGPALNGFAVVFSPLAAIEGWHRNRSRRAIFR